MKKLTSILLSLCCFSSCSYDIIKERDSNTGKVYKQRFYKDTERQERYFDTKIFRYWYKEENYSRANSLAVIGDSLVMSDSMKFLIRSQDSSFACLFFTGIISGNVFDKITGARYTLQMTDLETGITTPPKKIDYAVIHSFKILDFFNIGDNRMRIKFKSTPFTYYIEIESDSLKNQSTLSDFISHSKLTFIHKCCAEI